MPPKVAQKGTVGRPSTAKANSKAGQTSKAVGAKNSVITSNNAESSYLLVEYESQLQSAGKEIEELKLENQRLKSRQGVKQDHNEVATEKQALKSKNTELQKELEVVKEALKKAQANTETREPVESLQTKVEESKKEVQELKDERQKTKREHEESIRTVKRHHASEIAELQKKLAVVEEALKQAQADAEILQKIDDTERAGGRIERTQSDQMPEHDSENSRKNEQEVLETPSVRAEKNERKNNQETGEQKSIPQMEGLIQSLKIRETNLLTELKEVKERDEQHLQIIEEKLEVIKGLEEKLEKLQLQLPGDQEPPERKNENMVNELQQLKESNQRERTTSKKLEADVRTLQDQLSAKVTENENLQKNIQTLKNEKEDNARILSKTKKDSEKYTEQESELKLLREQLSSQKQANNVLQQQINSQTQNERSLPKDRDEIARLKQNNDDLKKELSLTSGSQPEQVRKLREEMENLKNRLSQASASQLLNNNPNIADLSDSNRATKLAEKYTELYDNEWTDAFEEEIDSGNNTEKEAIKDLYDTLKGAYDHCTSTFTEYSKGAKKSLIYFRGQEGQYDKFPNVVDKQIKDTLKSFAPALTEKIIESFMSKKTIPDHPRKNMYMRKCIELCWLMAIQDPPVVLATENPTEFNSDLYKAYTKSGKHVDYVVMPPLHLHKGGALLAKGTAQGKL